MRSVVIVASSPRMAIEMGKPLAGLGLRLLTLNSVCADIAKACADHDVVAVVVDEVNDKVMIHRLFNSVRHRSPPVLAFEDARRLKRRVSVLMLKNNCIDLIDQRESTFHLSECLSFDSKERVIRSANGDVRLARAEIAILSWLAENQGALVYKGELLRKVWGRDDKAASRTLDVHLFGLRRKLAQISRHIRITSVRRVGLILESSPA